MPQVSPTPAGSIGYGPAGAGDAALFAAVPKASGGLLVSASVRTLTVGGRDVGGVAVYGTRPGAAASTMFQDQYVVQLVDAVARTASPPRFVRAGNQVIALSTGPAPVAGWFQGDHVVLVYRQGAAPDLTSLAVGVRNTPPAR